MKKERITGNISSCEHAPTHTHTRTHITTKKTLLFLWEESNKKLFAFFSSKFKILIWMKQCIIVVGAIFLFATLYILYVPATATSSPSFRVKEEEGGRDFISSSRSSSCCGKVGKNFLLFGGGGRKEEEEEGGRKRLLRSFSISYHDDCIQPSIHPSIPILQRLFLTNAEGGGEGETT